MDTTEQYIKMCEKAVEMQALWKVTEGDFCIERDVECRTMVGCIDDGQAVWDGDEKIIACWHRDCIWLPRQDQLQEMMLEYTANSNITLMETLIFRIKGDGRDVYGKCCSMEQLWLAFVMKEKFNKVWTGEQWKTIST